MSMSAAMGRWQRCVMTRLTVQLILMAVAAIAVGATAAAFVRIDGASYWATFAIYAGSPLAAIVGSAVISGEYSR